VPHGGGWGRVGWLKGWPRLLQAEISTKAALEHIFVRIR
jgi:hypothetical protein